MSIRVLVVGEHQAVREALVMRLRGFPELDVLGSAPDLREGLTVAGPQVPDVILLDLQGVALQEIEAIRDLASRPGPVPASAEAPAIIALASYEDEGERERARGAGIQRYLLKTIDSGHLLTEIRSVAPE